MATVQHNEEGKGGNFTISEDGRHAGAMYYEWDGDKSFTITHTEVDEAFNGRGLGKDMVEAAVKYAREKNAKIKPECPFAKAMLQKHAEWQDVL